jgi:hypothetical protein
VLRSKLEVFIFKEAIHQDDEFAHAGCYGDQWLFARGAQPLVKSFENAVMSDGAHRGHVERPAHGCSPAVNVSDPGVISAVSIVGRQACQCGGRSVGELTQFGHFGQNSGGNDRTDSRNGVEPLSFARQLRVSSDEFQDGLIAGFDLLLQQPQRLASLPPTQWICIVFGAIALSDPGGDELAAAGRKLGQSLLLLGGRGRGCGSQRHSKGCEDGGIDRIGFGTLALSACEVAHPSSFHNRDGNACSVECAHDQLFVTAGGFTNDLRMRERAQEFEQLNVTFGIIVQAVKTALEMQLQCGLGNVQAGVEDGDVVLTHTCGNASHDDLELSCSSNGSSLDQRADVERAPRRITQRAYARRKRSRADLCLAACRRPGNSSLASSFSRTKWTIFQIQGAEIKSNAIWLRVGACPAGCGVIRTCVATSHNATGKSGLSASRNPAR